MSETWARAVRPTDEGLPNRRVIFVPLIALALIFVSLVAGGVTGSSTGYLNQFFSSKADSRLLFGNPQAIRSDEWLVATSWTISQVEQGLPVRNDAFPGGMDTTVQHDLPSWDWSMAFRPHLWGFLFLPLDNAMAVKWWLPMLSLIAAGYLFVVSLVPRRPVIAGMLSIGFVFQPFFQWWFLSITFWPAVWALLVCTAVVWLLRSRRRRGGRIALSAAAGFTTVTMGMGIYVPFMIPVALAAAAFGLGAVVGGRDSSLGRLRDRVRSIVPLLVAGLGAIAIMVVWLATRWSTIEGFTSTVYPGQRLQATGHESAVGAIDLLSAPVQRGLSLTSGAPLQVNQSEASTFFFLGLLILPVLIWLLVRDRIEGRRVDLPLVLLLVATAVMFAFIFLPNWDAIAHLLLLDRTTYGRMRIGVAMASFLLVAVAVARLDARPSVSAPVPVALRAVTAVFAAIVVAVPIVYLFGVNSPLVKDTRWWMLIAVLMVTAAAALVGRRAGIGGTAYALVGVLLTVGTTNPLYHGVYDLNRTRLVETMKSLDSSDHRWVGVGNSFLTNVVLTQSGLESFNGFQSTPSEEMWDEIDPGDRYHRRWDRLANVSWYLGTGAPLPRNPAPDQIRMNFDSCSAFAQKEVEWVLSDAPVDQPCATKVAAVREGPTVFFIYRVTSR